MKTLIGAVLGLVLALSLTACGDDISASDREKAPRPLSARPARRASTRSSWPMK